MIRNKLIVGLQLLNFIVLLNLSSLALASSSLRINVQELNQQLNLPGLVILDTRSAEEYAKSHIPNAINLPEELTYFDRNKDGRIAQPAQIKPLLQSLGIERTSPIVIYDQGKMIKAARVFWALEVYGIENIKVLNKGFYAWNEAMLPSNALTPSVKPSNYVPIINHNRLATKLTTLIATKNPNSVIIDARSKAAYQGQISSAARYGHIINAINIPAMDHLITSETASTLKSAEELKALYSGISKDQKIILYCSIGRISSTNYLTLRELGYNVSNYDASWSEWGNDFTLPIQ
ncbi:sulfurtransferase [Thiomicrorhabdus sp. Milos-T2]|uniref:sulfurtransferase n=1 Tax=Thiomicrorhabdus sp. Milos-T2 TaxID=90814 RepID=UPI00068D27F7|nr:sulfurtransferase [Thiomicrorhabdus sp. Milos-T2]